MSKREEVLSPRALYTLQNESASTFYTVRRTSKKKDGDRFVPGISTPHFRHFYSKFMPLTAGIAKILIFEEHGTGLLFAFVVSIQFQFVCFFSLTVLENIC